MFARKSHPTPSDVGEWVIAHSGEFPIGIFANIKGEIAEVYLDDRHYIEIPFHQFSILNADGDEDDLQIDDSITIESILDKIKTKE